MIGDTERLLPILIYIQAHLDCDLSLDALAERAKLSPFHFHRIFRNTVGETVKQYVQRLRLERAAYQLKIQSSSIIDIAFSVGYQSHETFSRAFRRHFDLSPQEYRQTYRLEKMTSSGKVTASSLALNERSIAYEISNVHFCTLEPISVAFIRSLGDYSVTDLCSFARLVEWAKLTNRYTGYNLLIGIGHDDPNVTPMEKIRYDACIEVDQPFDPEGGIGCQTTPHGTFATVTYVGPYGTAMYEAYGTLFFHVQQQHKYAMVGLPAVEIYRTTQINPRYQLNQTDIFIPVEEKI